MYSKFLEGMTGKVSEQWVTNLLTPAFAFWLGGLAAGIYHFGCAPLKTWALQQPQPVQVGLLIVGLIVIVTSAAVAQKFDRPMLRFLEGYWPRWMKTLRRIRTQRYVNQWQQQQQRWGELYGKGETALSAEELNEYAKLDWQLMHSPSQPNQFMPTHLGNLLRASEYRSKEKNATGSMLSSAGPASGCSSPTVPAKNCKKPVLPSIPPCESAFGVYFSWFGRP